MNPPLPTEPVRMRIVSWVIIVVVLLPFAGITGFLLFSMVKNAVEDSRREPTWRAWRYHAAFVVLLVVVAGLFAYSIYLVVSTLLSA